MFEQAAKRAIDRGTLVIAAAGNESRRPGHIDSVSHPANCPSIMAVGAIDERRLVADFSCGTVDSIGQIDLDKHDHPARRRYRRADRKPVRRKVVGVVGSPRADRQPPQPALDRRRRRPCPSTVTRLDLSRRTEPPPSH